MKYYEAYSKVLAGLEPVKGVVAFETIEDSFKLIISETGFLNLNYAFVEPQTYENSDRLIKEVIGTYKRYGVSSFFLKLPKEIDPSIVKDNGFTPVIETIYMTWDLQNTYSHQASIDVSIEKTTELDKLISCNSEGFEMSQEESKQTIYGLTANVGLDSNNYIATVDNKIVACATDLYSKNVPDYILFAGGCTIPSYRGKGIYKAILAKRIQDLQSSNYSMVLTEAMAHTSAPILKQVGFVDTNTGSVIYQYTGK